LVNPKEHEVERDDIANIDTKSLEYELRNDGITWDIGSGTSEAWRKIRSERLHG
jgi:hypothetical protein